MPDTQPASIAYHTMQDRYHPSSKGIIHRVVSDRLSFFSNAVEELNRLLEKRHRLEQKTLSRIDQDMCRTQTLLYELDTMPSPSPGLKVSLEAQLIHLCQERRQQEHSHWTDTANMTQALLRAERELREELWAIAISRKRSTAKKKTGYCTAIPYDSRHAQQAETHSRPSGK